MRQRNIHRFLFFGFFLILLIYGCESQGGTDFYLGEMPIPSDNPMTTEKIELGRQLFFDKRLSPDNSVSCSTCHQPNKAFTDGLMISKGFHNRMAMRNAPTLLNVGFLKKLMFDGEVPNLEMQVLVPLKDSAEMANDMRLLISKLNKIPKYNKQAKQIFQRDFDAYVLTRSLASFQRSLISDHTPYDQYVKGDRKAMSLSAIRGYKLFTEKLYCTKCHTPPFFTNFKVENNGLYADYTNISDKGRFRIHGDSSEIGMFKVPTLRNISRTFPYMHDGSIVSLDEVIEHYVKGGSHSPFQSKTILPFQISVREKNDLIEFLKALSDAIPTN